VATEKKPPTAAEAATPEYPAPTDLNLYQRQARVMADVELVVKRGQTQFGERFKYAKIDDVMAALRPSMARHGLVVEFDVDIAHSSRSEYGATKSGTMQWLHTVWVNLELVNADAPDDRRSCLMVGEGIDTGDKGVGKALSYAYKNFLLKTFLLPSGDEADNEAFDSSTTKPVRVQQEKKRAEEFAGVSDAEAQADLEHRRAQSGFFAALNEQGIAKDLARDWLKRNHGVESTKVATTEQLKGARAWALGYQEAQKAVQEGTSKGGLDLMLVARHISEAFGVESPGVLTLAEWQELGGWVARQTAKSAAEAQDDEDLAQLDSFTKRAAEVLDATEEEPEP